jgi:peptidyl-dipeptidase A
MDKEIIDFLERQNKEISNLSKKANLAYFDAITLGKDELYEEYEKYAQEIEKYFENKTNFELIKKYLKENIEDELIKRQLEVLYRSYLGSQGDSIIAEKIIKKSIEIEKRFNTFRAEINGKEYTDNEIKDVLRTETDSLKLQKFWEASKKQAEGVEKELLEIIDLRNTLARELGYGNYFEMSLDLNEQKEEEIDKIFNELNEKSERAFSEIKKEIDDVLKRKYKVSELKPWHYQNLFFQEAPEIYDSKNNYYKKDIIEKAKKFYKEVGVDVEDILERSDLYEREGKYQHACCMDIDQEGDVRIVQNVKNDEYWMKTTLHELGHAIYDKYQDFKLPYVLRGNNHIFVTEAIALFFERQATNIEFIKKFSDSKNIDEDKVSEISKKELQIEELVFSRWSQVMYNFEKELYRNPNQELNKLWWSMVKKYQKIDFTRDKPDWASKIHFVSAPVYYQNYLLGKILVSQLKNYIQKNIFKKDSDYFGSEQVGNYLRKEIFTQGKKCNWEKLIENATGEKLTPEYFVKEFCK